MTSQKAIQTGGKVLAKKLLKPLFSVLLIAIILYESKSFLKDVSLKETWKVLSEGSWWAAMFFVLLGIASILVTALYDYLVVRAFSIPLPLRKIWKVAFIATAVNNVTGAFPTGVGLKLLLFRRRGVKEKDIRKINLMIYPATMTGLGVLMGIDLLFYSHLVRFVEKQSWTMLVIVGYLIYVPIYVWFNDLSFSRFKLQLKHVKDKKETATRIRLLLVSTLDWFLAASLFYFLTLYFHSPISFLEAISILSISTALGVVSMIPGGIGSFDLMVLLGFQYYGVSHETGLAILLLFRLFYYVIPLLMSGALLLWEYRGEVRKAYGRMKTLTAFEEAPPTADAKDMGDLLGSLMIRFLAVLTLLSGAVLILSAATPGMVSRIRVMQNILSLPVLQFSHRISLMAGILLILLSAEVLRKVHRAFLTILVMLGLGMVFTFLKGMDLEEGLFLLISSGILFTSKPAFRRKSAPYGTAHGAALLLAVLGTGIYMFSGLNSSGTGKDQLTLLKFLHFTPTDFMVNGSLAFLFAGIIYLLWRRSLPKPPFPSLSIGSAEEEKIKGILSAYGGNELSHLLFLGDKRLFFACGDEVLFAYAVSRGSLIVLGDPIGNEERFEEGMLHLEYFADTYGYCLVFYQVKPKLMPLYHEFGYDFFKLGEEAVVDLQTFDLSGPDQKSLRNVRNRMDKEGYTFEVLESREEIVPHIDELREISEEWLGGRKEKRFSLGFFSPDYLLRAPVLILKNQEGAIFAFASLMPGYRGTETISVDLMRHKEEGPNGLMDYLFLQLFEWAKAHGFQYFNLGMAPLLHVGKSYYASDMESMASVLYQYGSSLYSFEGLYRFKNKFHPRWTPKYLGYKKDKPLFNVLLSVIRLIN